VVWPLQRSRRSFPCQLRRAGSVDLRVRFVVSSASDWEKTIVGLVNVVAYIVCEWNKKQSISFSSISEVKFYVCSECLEYISLS
jgi:hypothetical protein